MGVGIDDKAKMEEISADLALQIQAIIRENSKRDWIKNLDLQNKMKSEIEDALFDASTREGFKLSFETMDRILEESLVTAKIDLVANDEYSSNGKGKIRLKGDRVHSPSSKKEDSRNYRIS